MGAPFDGLAKDVQRRTQQGQNLIREAGLAFRTLQQVISDFDHHIGQIMRQPVQL
jgi:hypothetical protein